MIKFLGICMVFSALCILYLATALPRNKLEPIKIKKNLNKNLVYDKAEPWAKQNIELLFEDVYNWTVKSIETIDFKLVDEKAIKTWFGSNPVVINWKNKNINMLFFYDFQNFKVHLFQADVVRADAVHGVCRMGEEMSDAEFMEILIEDINLIAHRINSAGGNADPEQIIPRIKSLFWSC